MIRTPEITRSMGPRFLAIAVMLSIACNKVLPKSLARETKWT